jgi:catalase
VKQTPNEPARERAIPTKQGQLEEVRVFDAGQSHSTDQGIPIPHTDDSLKGSSRGPTLLEDFHFREKMTRFDHERIPERVVHARGSGAHGYFQVYEPLTDLSQADFLSDPSLKTPVFVRFSTVQGNRGSADTVRDVRGFATKFYTRQGNFDLVGNNIPVFFIQDGIKFPDIVHAVKPEPHHEMPQASSAHDTFWDFVSLVPETAHMVMWLMSDRGIPRSYRMMEGFGVHTFKLVNVRGEVKLCKFHWKPLLGAHSLIWDEAQKIAGKDPDFHRRDLWEAIEAGQFPEYELGLQVVDEKDELAFGFDLLDATKVLPEELVPVRRVGKMVLDRNPDNFFAETEQIAFCVQNLVPGIDVSNDPLMQARLFSYLDTQLTRLGGPNFHQLPINRPVAPVHNHQQDGFHQHTVPTKRANYHPNSIDSGCPFLASLETGYVHQPQPVEGHKTRQRSATFADHFSQAKTFLDSQSVAERRHLVEAFQFEVGRVVRPYIRERVLQMFRRVDEDLAAEIAVGLGLTKLMASTPPPPPPQTIDGKPPLPASPALSLLNQPRTSIKGRKVAILASDGARADDILLLQTALAKEAAVGELIAPHTGSVELDDGSLLPADKSIIIAHSVLYDAVFVVGGAASAATLAARIEPVEFVQDAFRHVKTIGAVGEGAMLFTAALVPTGDLPGVIVGEAVTPELADAFIAAMKQHRHFERESKAPPGVAPAPAPFAPGQPPG